MLELLLLMLFGLGATSIVGSGGDDDSEPDDRSPDDPPDRPAEPIDTVFYGGETGHGSDGDDRIVTSGPATVFAGEGAGEIRSFDRTGQTGGPTVHGEGGDDTISVWTDEGSFYGDDGNDFLDVHNIEGTLLKTATLYGGSGDDILLLKSCTTGYGNSGDDQFVL